MFQLKNGILYHDGAARFALGQSYYPSYHPQKVPVPENGDRIGEMKKDLRAMLEAGFSLVRIAALGEIGLDKQTLKLNFPLPDAILKEMNDLDMAAMVRLEGYSIDLHNRDDATMLDADGKEMPFYWSWFVRNCLNHPGIMEDNRLATLESARYFSRYPNVVSYQIYNEAAYPTKGFYDYNPHTISAYRKWLVDTGKVEKEQAERYEPPRKRPEKGREQEWVNFRMFNLIRMSGFLGDLSDTAKAGYPAAETLTCHMASPCLQGMATRGEDYFDIAERMDIVGITHYVATSGPDYFTASLVLDAAESAAATYGKHAWLIEYNARVDCTLHEWERETYNAVGAGFKGILYYQWRADYPFEGAPEPNGFGMVQSDNTKTDKFDGAVAMTRQLDRLSPYLVTAEKLRSGVGILYSQHAGMWYDATDNNSDNFYQAENRYIEYLQRIYTELRKNGVTADLVRACDLDKNPLGVKLLFIPSWEGLSAEETADISAYAAQNPVYCYGPYRDCFFLLSEKETTQREIDRIRLKTVLSRHAVKPAVQVRSREGNLSVGTLTGENALGRHMVITLVNYDEDEKPVKDAELYIDPQAAKGLGCARFITPRENVALKQVEKDGKISILLPEIATGCYVILSEQPASF